MVFAASDSAGASSPNVGRRCQEPYRSVNESSLDTLYVPDDIVEEVQEDPIRFRGAAGMKRAWDGTSRLEWDSCFGTPSAWD